MPPISWLVLAIIWFRVDGKASIFIAVIETFPLIVINLVESIRNIDYQLIEMGEVLSCNNGIGGEFTNARVNIETSYVFAWTIIIVILFYITNKILSHMFNTKIKGERYAFKDSKFN